MSLIDVFDTRYFLFVRKNNEYIPGHIMHLLSFDPVGC
jgi:hypothetical protein